MDIPGSGVNFEYNLDYFSGSQANVYLGPILLDEVTSLQWNVHQAKIPVYGYASQFFDEMVRGSVIVQGQFAINFIEPNYLFSVLEAWKNLGERRAGQDQEDALKQKMKDTLNAYASGTPNNADLWKAIKEIDEKEKDLANDYFFKKINDTIWGPSASEKVHTSSGRPDDADFNGFDIKIDFKWETQDSHKSSQTIKNVHILGSSRAIMIDEQPIQEVYSFYAQKVESLPSL